MITSTFEFRIEPGKIASCALFLAASGVLGACGGGDAGEGTVRVMAYGEEFIEEGIAASEVDDGWEIEFDRFEVTISGVELGGELLSGAVTVDLAAPSGGEGHEIGELEVPSGDHTGSSYTVDRVEVEGTATQDEVTMVFHWVFEDPVTYAECETITRVVEGEETTFQVTIHADHLFYDSLVAASPQLLFSPLAAADGNEDGEISSAELAATDIGPYDPGNEDANDLWSFLVALNATIGHVNGEAHCTARSVAE